MLRVMRCAAEKIAIRERLAEGRSGGVGTYRRELASLLTKVEALIAFRNNRGTQQSEWFGACCEDLMSWPTMADALSVFLP